MSFQVDATASLSQNVYAPTNLDSSAHGVPITAKWSSNEFDCSRDWETCWWGAWCCCILSNRTAGTFKKGSSFRPGFQFTVSVIASFLILPYNSLAGILLILISVTINAFYRAKTREAIRSDLGIPGSFSQDFINHCLIPCCTVCQEAREAKFRYFVIVKKVE